MSSDISGVSHSGVRRSGNGRSEGEGKGGESGEEGAANAVHERPTDTGTRFSSG